MKETTRMHTMLLWSSSNPRGEELTDTTVKISVEGEDELSIETAEEEVPRSLVGEALSVSVSSLSSRKVSPNDA